MGFREAGNTRRSYQQSSGAPAHTLSRKTPRVFQHCLHAHLAPGKRVAVDAGG